MMWLGWNSTTCALKRPKPEPLNSGCGFCNCALEKQMPLQQNLWTRPHCTCINNATEKKNHISISSLWFIASRSSVLIFIRVICNNNKHFYSFKRFMKRKKELYQFMLWFCCITVSENSWMSTFISWDIRLVVLHIKSTISVVIALKTASFKERRHGFTWCNPIKNWASKSYQMLVKYYTRSYMLHNTERGQIQEIKLLSLSFALFGLSGFLSSNNLTKCPCAEKLQLFPWELLC